MRTNLWTWSGRYFGYRDDDDLWTYPGEHVGKFIENEVFDPEGNYLGEIRGDDWLITKVSKGAKKGHRFSPRMNRMGKMKRMNRSGRMMLLGYEDFPELEQ